MAQSGLLATARELRLAAEVVRAKCCVAAGGYVLLGVYVSGSDTAFLTPRTWSAALALALIVAAAFAHNDVEDEAADRESKPTRPIPSGRVSRHKAMQLAIALAGAGLIITCVLDRRLATFAASYVVLSAMYSRRLKATVLAGNVTIAFLMATIPI